ncbi:MAG: TetR/AcrR family transcriptional regulator [Chloroflexi bacterium]|nr:TetR/AcrR family transcriptional regulator [Chloroflexota bacterium]
MTSDPRRSVPKDPESTKARILDAALDVFSTKGYHDATVDEIVEASSTSKGSVYFHFPNKQRLFIALVDRFADLLERRVIESITQHDAGIDRVRAALEACLETFGRYRRLAKVLLVQAAGLGAVFEQKRQEVLERFAGLVKTYLDEAIEVGDLAPTDTEVVSHAWIGAINAVVIRWVYSGSPTPDRILSTLLPILLRGVGFEEVRNP